MNPAFPALTWHLCTVLNWATVTKNGEVAQRLFVHENRCLWALEDRRMKARGGNGIAVDSAAARERICDLMLGKSAKVPENWVNQHLKTILVNCFWSCLTVTRVGKAAATGFIFIFYPHTIPFIVLSTANFGEMTSGWSNMFKLNSFVFELLLDCSSKYTVITCCLRLACRTCVTQGACWMGCCEVSCKHT